jgi:hypothetical protein
MINLLPPAAKKSFRHEYRLRVAIVWLLLFNLVLWVAAVLSAPSFVLVESQLQAYESQIQSANALAREQRELVETVTASNDIARQVNTVATIPKLKPFLMQAEALSGPDVRLSQLSVVRQGTTIESIEVAGIAATRRSLTDFSNALVADERFSEAVVPISNLAANQDIPFTLTIVVAPEN